MKITQDMVLEAMRILPNPVTIARLAYQFAPEEWNEDGGTKQYEYIKNDLRWITNLLWKRGLLTRHTTNYWGQPEPIVGNYRRHYYSLNQSHTAIHDTASQ